MKKSLLFFILFSMFFSCNVYAYDSLNNNDMSDIFPESLGTSEKEVIFEPDMVDLDNDSLLDGAEIAAGTDPDTDNDSMQDYWEVTKGTNPLVNDRNVDLDSDLYSNIMEYVFHSDPSDPNDTPANASKSSYIEYNALEYIIKQCRFSKLND
jgi:hypothetical protein